MNFQDAKVDQKTRYCPHTIFQLTQRNPTLSAFVQEWKFGNLTWEQMLVGMVAEVVKMNEVLMDAATKAYWRNPIGTLTTKGLAELEKNLWPDGAFAPMENCRNRVVVEARSSSASPSQRYCFPFDDNTDPSAMVEVVRKKMANTIFGPLEITSLDVERSCPEKGMYLPFGHEHWLIEKEADACHTR